jgi:hypothetical protein
MHRALSTSTYRPYFRISSSALRHILCSRRSRQLKGRRKWADPRGVSPVSMRSTRAQKIHHPALRMLQDLILFSFEDVRFVSSVTKLGWPCLVQSRPVPFLVSRSRQHPESLPLTRLHILTRTGIVVRKTWLRSSKRGCLKREVSIVSSLPCVHALCLRLNECASTNAQQRIRRVAGTHPLSIAPNGICESFGLPLNRK